MQAVPRAHTLAAPVSATLTLTEVAERLAWQAIDERPERPVELTLLGISVSNLTRQEAVQLELPLPPPDPWRPGSPTGAARWALDRSMDAVRDRFGRSAVGYLPVTLGRRAGVPEEFRELAEREL